MHLLTGFLWFLAKFIFLGAVSFAGIKAGAAYRKNKDMKIKA